MKVFWFLSFVPNEIKNTKYDSTEVSGGWIQGMLDATLRQDNLEITIVFKTNKKAIKYFFYNSIRYVGIPSKNYCKHLYELLIVESPDVIHIWGTEFSICLETIEVAKQLNICNRTMVSLQGIISEIKNYLTDGLPINVIAGQTIYELFRRCSIKKRLESFKKRSIDEEKALKSVFIISGRTEWDYSFVDRCGLSSKYRKVNENLRASFYNNEWKYEKCQKLSILVSRGDSSIKGFHILLEAFKDIIKEFPSSKLLVAGDKPFEKGKGIKSLLKQTKYGKYVKSLIFKNSLQNHIEFLGPLNEIDMLKAYLRANVFVMPSLIENSSNSLSEAMLLGVPCVATIVGGTSSLLNHGQEGLLCQSNSSTMLYHYISYIFKNPSKSLEYGKNARKKALLIHNRNKNAEDLLNIYKEIVK